MITIAKTTQNRVFTSVTIARELHKQKEGFNNSDAIDLGYLIFTLLPEHRELFINDLSKMRDDPGCPLPLQPIFDKVIKKLKQKK